MEYSLLKQIVPNKAYFPIGATSHPSHFPGFDCVNPGIGNVASPFTYFVPSHSFSNPNIKVKKFLREKDIVHEQEGRGDDTTKDEDQEPLSTTSILPQSTDEETEEILNKLNARKKKLLDQAIYESFLHPKKIKTEVLKLTHNNPKAKSKTKVEGVEHSKDKKISEIHKEHKEKLIKHKFKFE